MTADTGFLAEITKLGVFTADDLCAIEFLQESRTALISGVVTGKIDVRELAEAEAAET
jgi:hypothetical protein